MTRHTIMRKVGIILLCVGIVVYGMGYVALRANHRIGCYSNAHHWDAGKRSPGYFVRVANEQDRFIAIAFKPPMLIEQAIRNVID